MASVTIFVWVWGWSPVIVLWNELINSNKTAPSNHCLLEPLAEENHLQGHSVLQGARNHAAPVPCQIPSCPISEEDREYRLVLVHGLAFSPVCVCTCACVCKRGRANVHMRVCAVCVCVIYKCKDNSKFLVGTKWGTVKYEKWCRFIIILCLWQRNTPVLFM